MNKSKEPIFEGRRWLSIREAGVYLSVSHETVRNWLNAGLLTRYKLGPGITCRVLVSREELDRFVERHQQQPAIAS